jgi:hypothetical protein
MRMLMKVSIPVEAGNRAVKEGLLPGVFTDFVERMKPEACYFTTDGGRRTAFFVFDLTDPTMMPSAAEPFFTSLDAAIDWSPVMNLDDLKVGVEKIRKRG